MIGLKEDTDPLLRGNIAYFIGCLLRTFIGRNFSVLEGKQDLSLFDPVEMIKTLISEFANDTSSITSKLGISAIGECLPSISNFLPSQLPFLIKQLLSCTNNYWLVTNEILLTISSLDFSLLHFLFGEESFSLQSLCLGFIFDCLGKEDARVRECAADSLQRIIPKLFFCSALTDLDIEKYNFPFHQMNEIIMFGNLSNVCIVPNLVSNLGNVVDMLISELNKKNSKTKLKGLFTSFKSLVNTYSNPQNYVQHPFYREIGNTRFSPFFLIFTEIVMQQVEIDQQYDSFPNPVSCYYEQLVPFAISRLSETDLLLDLDLHIDILIVTLFLLFFSFLKKSVK